MGNHSIVRPLLGIMFGHRRRPNHGNFSFSLYAVRAQWGLTDSGQLDFVNGISGKGRAS
jgi:hypothetical protein